MSGQRRSALGGQQKSVVESLVERSEQKQRDQLTDGRGKPAHAGNPGPGQARRRQGYLQHLARGPGVGRGDGSP